MEKAVKWRDIGKALGFTEGEMENIQGNMMLALRGTNAYLGEMLSSWLEWAPGDGRGSTNYATKESLHAALLKAGMGQVAKKFE